MKKSVLSFLIILFVFNSFGQTLATKLAKAYKIFETDSQLKNGIASLYVINAKTGKVVFEKNPAIGLAPASTQKIITSATAYELLGKDFRFETTFGYYGALEGNKLNGGIYIKPSGDPTLGSWRWKHTTEDAVLNRLITAMQKTGIKTYGSFVLDATGWEGETIPGGWMWDDIGNYYGAGAEVLNWRENQYDLILKSGTDTGSLIAVVGTTPTLYNYNIFSKATAAPKGTGDNAYIYFPVTSSSGIVRGTIPVNENRFVISGAMPSARSQFLATLNDSFSKRGINKEFMDLTIDKFSKSTSPSNIQLFHTETSPPLDSVSYWFLKRSINLYGEALAKTIAVKQQRTATSDNGAEVIRKFWSDKGIGVNKTELNIHDGSGLSPLNRTTTHSQVAILQYAKKQEWFSGYFYGFPEYNGMKMKSGTISGVKGFCGYHKSKSGEEYIFSFLVNNYNGSSSSLVQKMYKVLDVLK